MEGVILAPQRNPDLQGSCSIATSFVYLIRVNKIPSNLTHCDPFVGCLAVERAPCMAPLWVFQQQIDIHGNLVPVGALAVTSLIKQAQSQSRKPGLKYMAALVSSI